MLHFITIIEAVDLMRAVLNNNNMRIAITANEESRNILEMDMVS
jgi:hypothetical protein